MKKQRSPLTGERQKGRVSVRRLTRADEVASTQIAKAVRAALGGAALKSINVVLLDDARISELHRDFMGEPGATDVITFDLRDAPEQRAIEGEIVISVETARRQARRYRAETGRELLRYVIHGVLHLLGYDDNVPAGRRRMRREENRVLNLLGEPRPRRRSGRGV